MSFESKDFIQQLQGGIGDVRGYVEDKLDEIKSETNSRMATLENALLQTIQMVSGTVNAQIKGDVGRYWVTPPASVPATVNSQWVRMEAIAPGPIDKNRFICALMDITLTSQSVVGYSALTDGQAQQAGSLSSIVNRIPVKGNSQSGAIYNSNFRPITWALDNPSQIYRPTRGILVMPLGFRSIGQSGLSMWFYAMSSGTIVNNCAFVYRSVSEFVPY